MIPILFVLLGSDPIPGLLLDEFCGHDDWDLLGGDPFALIPSFVAFGDNPAPFDGNPVVFDGKADNPGTITRKYRGVKRWVPGRDLGRFQLDPRIEGVD